MLSCLVYVFPACTLVDRKLHITFVLLGTKWVRKGRWIKSAEVEDLEQLDRWKKWSLRASMSPLCYHSPLPELSNSMGIISGKYLLLTIM